MGQNGSNWDRVHIVSIGPIGETRDQVENGENRKKQGKCVMVNLNKSKSRAFATQANKPKVSFEQSKSFKIKKWEIF